VHGAGQALANLVTMSAQPSALETNVFLWLDMLGAFALMGTTSAR